MRSVAQGRLQDEKEAHWPGRSCDEARPRGTTSESHPPPSRKTTPPFFNPVSRDRKQVRRSYLAESISLPYRPRTARPLSGWFGFD